LTSTLTIVNLHTSTNKGEIMNTEYAIIKNKLTQVLLTAEKFDNEIVVVNVGDMGGYVRVECTPKGIIVTVINNDGDLLSTKKYDLKVKS